MRGQRLCSSGSRSWWSTGESIATSSIWRLCILPHAANAEFKKAISWSHCVKDGFDGLQAAGLSALLKPSAVHTRGDAAGGQGPEQGAFLFINHFSSPEHLLPSKTPLGEMLVTHAGVVCREEAPYSKWDTLAQNRVYPADGLAGFTRGFVLSRFHPHEATECIFCNTWKELSKRRGRRKIVCECDLLLSELWLPLCLALSTAVPCLTGSLALH